jgi:hypothetical protein
MQETREKKRATTQETLPLVTARIALELTPDALEGGCKDTEHGHITGLLCNGYSLNPTRIAARALSCFSSRHFTNLNNSALRAESSIGRNRSTTFRARFSAIQGITASQKLAAMRALGSFVFHPLGATRTLLHLIPPFLVVTSFIILRLPSREGKGIFSILAYCLWTFATEQFNAKNPNNSVSSPMSGLLTPDPLLRLGEVV